MIQKIVAILADADGTLITHGDLKNFPQELPQVISRVREAGVLFNLASGRPHFEQELLFRYLIGEQYKEGEAILSEGALLQFHGSSVVYNMGGLTSDQKREIDIYMSEHKLDLGLVRQNNNEKYQAQTGRVTPRFIAEGITDRDLLEKAYAQIKPAIETQFPGVEVGISADAVDIFQSGVTKASVTQKYSEVMGIALDQVVAIGDSGNDMPMFDVVGNAGGLVIYVGENPHQEKIVRGYKQYFIPNQKGPLGTIEALEYILRGI